MIRPSVTFAIVIFVALFIYLGAPRIAGAQIVNGGFESADAGWVYGGTSPDFGYGSDTVAYPTSATAPQGSRIAHLVSLAISTSNAATDFGHRLVSGNSEISQTFTANAGDWVSFDYREGVGANGGSGFDNASFIVTCGTKQVKADTFFNTIPGQSLANGWATYSFPPFATAGTYTFSAQCSAEAQAQPGGSTISESTADIDAVTLNSVPEPSSVALLIVTMVGGLAYVRKRRTRHFGGLAPARS